MVSMWLWDLIVQAEDKLQALQVRMSERPGDMFFPTAVEQKKQKQMFFLEEKKIMQFKCGAARQNRG